MLLGNTRELIARIDERTIQIVSELKDTIKPDLRDVRERVATIEGKITKFDGKSAQVFVTASPIALMERGVELLRESGFKKYIDDNKQSLLDMLKNLCSTKNQYDIQEQALNLFNSLDFKEFENNLKKAAFDYGVSLSVIRMAGGIYFRDIALKEAGFEPEDLDSPKSSNNL